MNTARFRPAILALLGVVVAGLTLSVQPPLAAQDEEEIALEPIGDYPRVLMSLDRQAVSEVVERLAQYRSRVTGYPDAGLVLAPDPIPALDDFMRLARRGHEKLEAAAEAIWPSRERGSKRLPSNTELEEKLRGKKRGGRQIHRGIVEIEDTLELIRKGLDDYRARHRDLDTTSALTAQQRLAALVLRTSFDEVENAYRRAQEAVEAWKRLPPGTRIREKRRVVKAAELAVLKLDQYLNVPGDRFDSLPGYVESFKSLTLDELEEALEEAEE
ncbi:MAG: hypothetical protein ACE5O2_11330 [Armatimonadota bacterium]